MKKISCVFLLAAISIQPIYADTGEEIAPEKGYRVVPVTSPSTTETKNVVVGTAPASNTGEKVAAVGGAVVGGAGAVTAVSTLGVAGLGATGVTSGLAAVGGVVGGGMAAGVAITAAAPIAVGTATYVIYKKFFKKKK